MKNNCFPKVIVTCIDSWRDDVGANTIPNFFSEWNPESVAVVYTKSELPDSELSNYYFQIAENDVLHTTLRPGTKCGKQVQSEKHVKKQNQDYESIVQGINEEHRRYNFFRNHRWKVFYFARDLMWAMGAWKSKELDRFIENFNADVMFFPIYPYVYMNKLQAYIAKKAGVRGVAYIADDDYSYKPEWYNPLFWLQRFLLRKSVDEVMKYADELLVIAPKLQEEYVNMFNMPVNVLTKGIDVAEAPDATSEVELPLKMIYTGNLFIGRDKTIVKVVEAIKRINKDGCKIQLYIYSHIQLNDKLRSALNVDGSSYFMGAVPGSEVAEIQNSADIVLFVEGMDIFNRNKARLSFSTKLTDYFRSGKCIFAVGPEDIAPIDYLARNDAAIVATSKDEIETKLRKIIDKPAIVKEMGKKAYEVGVKNHSKMEMQKVFLESLKKASGSGNR